MSDRNAFLRAIIDRPDDDLPRLVYADWLDEHGEAERAEFIRVQCKRTELERDLDRGYGGRGVKGRGVNAINALRRRERAILDGDAWVRWSDLRNLSRILGGADYGPTVCRIPDPPYAERRIEWAFSRGFVSTVTLAWADWQRHADALLNAIPLRGVRRERACGECDRGRLARLDGWAQCRPCRGTGRVDAWAGGGRVVLTTRPEIADFGGDAGAVRYGLRGFRPVLTTDELGSVFAWHRMLDDAYPGVEFELPAARGVTVDFSALAGTEVEPGAGLRPGTVLHFGGRP